MQQQQTCLKATTRELRFHQRIYYNACSNLTQEIQLLEYMGGSNLPQASPNYLICMCFIRICMLLKLCASAS